jgi:thioesterase domain-containing protein
MASAFRAPVSGWPALSPPAGDGGHAAAPAASLPEAHVELVPGSIAASLPGGDSIPRHVDARRPLTRTAPPTDEMEIALTQIWETVLGIAHIGPNENFFDLGGHSLLAVALFEEIQRRYPEVQLPLAALLEAPTVASLAERLRGKGGDAWSPLVVIQAGRESTPLFCVHGAGGNVLFYRDLAVHMGPDQTVYGLQAQGLDGERPILTRVEDMAERYVREILRVQPNGPYYLVGYCLGGTIAFEIAQQLRAKGLETGFVAMLETYNWIKAVPETPWSRLRYQVQKIEFHLRNILQLSGEERRMFFREKLAELKRRRRVWTGHWFGRFRRASAPSRIEGPAGDALARVWAANDQAAEAYQPSAYPGRILHFRPVKEYNVNRPREMGWEGIVRQVDTHILPIFPAGMLIPPFVKQVAQVLRAELHKRRQDLRRLSQTPELPDTHA